ncbi:MAG: trypsin-like serine protease [Flavobacteriales bacterium]
MKVFSNLILVLFLTAYITSESNAQVVGGGPASTTAYPWMVDLDGGCGASLIRPNWVITAAHCVDLGAISIGDSVIINSHLRSNPQIGTEKRAVLNIYNYPGFSLTSSTYNPDVSLIELSTPSTLPPINFISDPLDTLLIQENDSCIVLGWGSTDAAGTQSDTLKEGRFVFVNRAVCETAYSSSSILWGKDSTHCAGYNSGSTPTGAGAGDSGGPLFVMKSGNPLLVGVVSGGGGVITTATQPGIYTNLYWVSNWIHYIISSPTSINEIAKTQVRAYFSNDNIIVNSKMKLANSSVLINVFDLSGKKLDSQKINLNMGLNTFTPNSNLPTGAYIITLTNQEMNVNFKLVKI